MTKYYKAMTRDLKCLGFQYEEGKTYEVEGPSRLCEHGFHFCRELVLTLEYYPVFRCITENRYAEIEVLGDLNWEDVIKHKGVTNKIRIARIIPDSEVLALVDDHSNSGHRNSGHSNSGNRNSGHSNSGHRNGGDWNSGHSNSGHSNSGNRNSGDWNSGNRNSGYSNSGHWNSVDNESGHFNSIQSETIRVFNTVTPIEDWESAPKPDFIFFEIDPELGYKKSFQKSFDKRTEGDIEKLKALPNFDSDVFYEISGIRIE